MVNTGENVLAVWLNELGLPAVEDLIPPPEEMAKTMGIPTLKDLASQIKSKAPLKLPFTR